MEDIIDIIVTETTNLIEITSQPTDEIIDVNIIDNREDVTLNVTPTVVEININSLTGNFGVNWGEITGTLSNQTDLQNALNLKADLVGGKVPSSQLPSYVDDVVEVANYAALPATGETGKIYVTIDTNYIYRWTGSTYVEIKDSSAVWGAITGTLSNQTDLQNALNAKANDNAVVHLAGTETITGAKTFSSAVTAPNFVLSGGTGNTGLYYGHTDRVVLANYTTGGIDFEVNGGSIVATLFPSGNYGLGITLDAGYKLDVNGTARISGALSGTSASFSSSITASSIIKSGGTSSQFLKADGSVDSNTYLTTSSAASTYVSGSGTTNYLPRWSSSKVLTDSFVYTNGNYTEIQGQGLTASMGIVVAGRYGSVANAPKIYSSDETTGVAHIEFVNGGGEIRLGVEKSTGGQILPGSSAYATVLTAGLSGRNLEFGTNNTKRLTIDGSTGAATFTSSVTASSHIVSGGTSSQFQKGDGSLDSNTYLTTSSASSTYLAKSGGTLTGALSGTSATFSSTITSTRNDAANVSVTIANAYFNQGNLINFQQNKAGSTINAYIGHGGDSTGNFIINNGTQALTITNSGAATFSSSVTATKAILNGSSATSGVAYLEVFGSTTASTNNGQIRVNDSVTTSKTLSIGVDGANNLAFLQSFQDGVAYRSLILNGLGGNVGIGTTSPSYLLHVKGSGAYNGAIFADNTGTTAGGSFQIGVNGTAVGSISVAGTYLGSTDQNLAYYAGSGLGHIWYSNAGSERMRITSGGNVGIGTTSPGTKLHIISALGTDAFAIGETGSNQRFRIGQESSYTGNYINSTNIDLKLMTYADGGSGGTMMFYTSTNTTLNERMRITSDGRLLVGTTSTYDARVTCYAENSSSSNYTFRAVNTNGQGIFSVRNDGQFRTGDGPSSPYNYTVTGRAIFSDSTGVLGYIASVREAKTNINSLANVSWIYDLNPVSFNYRKKDFNNNYTEDFYYEKSYGLIADEVEKVNKDLVFYDTVNGKKELRGVEYEKLVPALVKVVQELKSKIETLENK